MCSLSGHGELSDVIPALCRISNNKQDNKNKVNELKSRCRTTYMNASTTVYKDCSVSNQTIN